MSSKGILLDLDNTLYDYNAAHKPALEAVLAWLTTTLKQPREDVQAAYTESRRRVNHDLHGLASSHSRLLYFQGICEHFRVSPYEFAIDAEELYWKEFFQHMALRPGVSDFLTAVKDKPIAIVTDLTTKIQFQKITHLRLAPSLHAIVTSEEAGHEKPDPHIFELAMAKLRLAPEEVCMIGDSWERDIEGAMKLGIRSFWFRDGEEKSSRGDTASSPNRAPNGSPLLSEFNDFNALAKMI
jgi:putative hydrolase of the HAD superfamily